MAEVKVKLAIQQKFSFANIGVIIYSVVFCHISKLYLLYLTINGQIKHTQGTRSAVIDYV